MSVLAVLRCLVAGFHEPVRHPLGGFTCASCGHAAVDLSGMGFGYDAGYVAVLRKVYDREKGLTRTSEWEATRRGW